MTDSTRRCPRCGEVATFSGAYCRPCFADYMRERRGHPPLAVAACQFCGSNFQQARFTSRFCSPHCRESERYSRRRADESYKAGRAAYDRKYHIAHRDSRIRDAAAWRRENRDRHGELNRAWSAANAERLRGLRTAYRIANRDLMSAKEQRRRDRVKSVAFIVPTEEQMRSKLAYWGNHCWMCPAPADTVDHVKPIAAGGPHILANMRPACRSCNSAKNSKWFGPHSLSTFIRQ